MWQVISVLKSKKYIIVSLIILIVMFMLGYLFFYVQNNSHQSTKFNSDEKVTDSLITRTNMGLNNLHGKRRNRLVTLQKKVSDEQFIGAYIGVKNGKVVFSGQSGYGNSQKKVPFMMTSTLNVGSMQYLINNIMIMKLVQANQIHSSEDKVSEYVSELNSKITIKKLLRGSATIYINKSKLEDNSKTMYEDASQSPKKGYVSGNEQLKLQLIKQSSNLSYEDCFQKLIAHPMHLYSSYVATENDKSYASNIIGYKYKTQSGAPVQESQINDDFLYHNNTVNMSISDMIRFIHLFNSKKIGIDNKSVLYDDQGASSYFSNSNGKAYQNDSYGRYISIKMDGGSNAFVLVVSNFPNENLKDITVANEMINLLNE